ncbi:MAG TPA: hypothetical protein DDY78_09585 [Planctomycetales bacterium]|jgi:hypothetical protein|nr:hypothetical protein [Planctomycetales bacterium]
MTGSILLASESAETHALGEAITSLRSAPGGTEQLAAQIDLLTARCQAYPVETRQLWDWFEGQEPCAMLDDLREVFEGHLALLDERIRLVQEVQSLATEIGRGKGLSPHEAPLAEALGDLAAQRSRIGGIWERANAPMPPSTEPEWTTADCLAAIERGEYESAESILARLLAGGPLCKEDAE